jgi:hypothetical protein
MLPAPFSDILLPTGQGEDKVLQIFVASILDRHGLASLLLQILKICLLIISELSLSSKGEQRGSGLLQLICCALVIISETVVFFSHMATALTG